jgi:hypothetical protein
VGALAQLVEHDYQSTCWEQSILLETLFREGIDLSRARILASRKVFKHITISATRHQNRHSVPFSEKFCTEKCGPAY